MSYIYVKIDTMTKAKTELFDQKLRESARIFKALSHPARLAILGYLADTRSCITGDISDYIPLGRTTVNQHLKELKEAGLIQGHIQGVKTNYCLDPCGMKKLMKVMSGLSSWDEIYSIGPCSKKRDDKLS